MAGPVEGIKGVELGVWVAGPNSGPAARRDHATHELYKFSQECHAFG